MKKKSVITILSAVLLLAACKKDKIVQEPGTTPLPASKTTLLSAEYINDMQATKYFYRNTDKKLEHIENFNLAGQLTNAFYYLYDSAGRLAFYKTFDHEGKLLFDYKYLSNPAGKPGEMHMYDGAGVLTGSETYEYDTAVSAYPVVVKFFNSSGVLKNIMEYSFENGFLKNRKYYTVSGGVNKLSFTTDYTLVDNTAQRNEFRKMEASCSPVLTNTWLLSMISQFQKIKHYAADGTVTQETDYLFDERTADAQNRVTAVKQTRKYIQPVQPDAVQKFRYEYIEL